MKHWYSADELAGLPGLPDNRRNVLIIAKRDGWRTRRRRGRGGGFEYHTASLPAETRAHLAGSAVTGPAPRPTGADAVWSRYERAPQKHKDEGARRARILDEYEALRAGGMKARNAGEEIRSRHGASWGALNRWRAKVKGHARADWMAVLVPAYRGGGAQSECDSEAWDLFRADYLRAEQPAASACYERLERAAVERGWTIPSVDTLLARLRRELPREVILLAREGAEALDRAYPAQERDHSVFHALEAVNADGHKFDVFVRWPDGSIHRPVMVAWQDLYSGKVLGYRVDRTEHVGLVRLSLGDLVERWGIPAHAYLDNGRAFAAKWITGGASTRYRFQVREEDPAGLLTALGVEVHWTTPYRGQAKPIERAFRDLCEYVSKHPAFAGAYTGNRPGAKPENYASRAVPLEEFLRVLDQELPAHNARRGRRSRVCGGRSFEEAFAESYSAATIRKASPAQRRLWLLAAESVAASRVDGSLKLLGNRYWSEAVAPFAGQRLVVRFDPDRLHEAVHAYTADGEYVGAAECVLPVGFADVRAAKDHAKAKRERRRAVRAQLEAERRMTALEVAAQIPDVPEGPDPVAGAVRLLHPQLTAAAKPSPRDDDEENSKAVDAALKRALEQLEGLG